MSEACGKRRFDGKRASECDLGAMGIMSVRERGADVEQDFQARRRDRAGPIRPALTFRQPISL